jgi:FAD dependent oxidoreductase
MTTSMSPKRYATGSAGRLLRSLAVLLLLIVLPLPTGYAANGEDTASSCTSQTPLLVVGGTPAGVAAAVTAARMGTRVELTEARPYLGGDLTGAMLNMFDMDFGAEGIDLAQGVFKDIFGKLGMTFDVDTAKRVFLEEVRQEPLISLHLKTRPIAVIMHGSWAQAVVFEDLERRTTETVCAKRVVDATDDADIAAMAGVPYTLGREGSGFDRAMMSATLIFELGGVSWREVLSYTSQSTNRPIRRGGSYHGNVWGYGSIMRVYHPTEPHVAIYDLNLGLQDNRTVLVNGLLIFNVDGTDPVSTADGMRRGREELVPLLSYLRATAPGFENAYLIKSADYLYIRETRHMQGLYTLTAQDIVDGRVFWDAVGVASYPIDIHPYHPGELNPYAPHRYIYTVPLRSLIPVGVGNLIMSSRSISASYEAAASARVVPTTMEEGQAAGAAAVLSMESRVSLLQFVDHPELVHDLQGALHATGAYLLPETLASIGHYIPPWPQTRGAAAKTTTTSGSR